MARPEPKPITFEIDGQEVEAPEGMMLVDAAKRGDVEIPFFCYEPKLGQPVGACRMCLVEIEGMPKLQTSCSTPVKDGMVVVTTSDKVKQAQNAIVEFLLVNHPLDCPVCDKGGECPLQDISFGWGAGRSRFIEPKRHFKKPLELSPLVAIDRERCILCYRCVRFSQEIAEDYQLVFLERGDHTFVGTNDGRPYVAPFSGNIIELCPVGALTSTAYRFRARPWDIEDAGSICTLCPSHCNLKFTIRDGNRVVRVLARDNTDVDDGWLCDKGRFGYQAIHAEERVTAPMVRDGGTLREVSWERALGDAASALKRAGAKSAALVGGQATNEEGFLVQHLMREVLGSPHVESRHGGAIDGAQARLLAEPELSARLPDIDHADAVLVIDTELVDEAPIIDLRVRKAVRRSGTKLVVLSGRPSTLDPSATAKIRVAPGGVEAALGQLAGALGSARAREESDRLEGLDEAAALLGEADDVVVIWGERLSQGARGRQTVEALLATAGALGVADSPESGLIEIPAGSNGRGLREVGCLPNLGPGLADAGETGLGSGEVRDALGEDLSALLLFHLDPEVELSGDWESALDRAGAVIAFSDFAGGWLADHADVVFPASSYAEKEGTVTHPDGRIQRVRQSISHPDQVRPDWEVLAELCARLDKPLDVGSAPMVTELVTKAVPFYSGITLEEIGGKGVRWQDRDAASDLPEQEGSDEQLEEPPAAPEGMVLESARSLWAGHETKHAPSLRFLATGSRAELSAEDARRLGVQTGDDVVLRVNGDRVRATAAVRSAIPAGSVFLAPGTLEPGEVEVVKA
jgi:NADH-quinone oxidoreductase subunit G